MVSQEHRLEFLRTELARLVRTYGYEERDQPFQLSSAGLSRHYVDGKTATSSGKRIKLVAEAVDEITRRANVSFEAVGGPTVGADAISVAVAMALDKDWFFVRKEAKGHGRQKLIEGAVLSPGIKAVVVDDVATTGASILKAVDALRAMSVEVVLVIPLVDRGELTRPLVEALGIRYEPILTYRNLQIPAIGHE
ncbi:MAG: orotate phosphoribosyltransferase [Actinomycetota bacterium]